MLRRIILRFILPAVGGLGVGFLALAYATENEPNIPPWLLSLFSPGLKIAELLSPVQHQSLASTFSEFLRLAIAINALFYFILFSGIAYLWGRHRSR